MRLLGAASILLLLVACSRPAAPPPGAFEAGGDFAPIPALPFDWLTIRPEAGQTFEQFLQAKPHRPDRRHDKIYLQPLGEFPPGAGPSFQKLRELTEAFFQMEVVVRPPLDLADAAITSRRNEQTGHRQLLSTDLLAFLKQHVPADSFAFLGLTMDDIYPGDDWNFVFGQATSRRVGIYSLARYDPQFLGGARPADWQKTMLLRSSKVLAHETTHMFGIPHCVFYNCLINGSNSLEETDLHPLEVCPVDLRKLHHSIGFDVIERYEDLQAFCAREGLDAEAAWYRRRIEHLRR